MRQHFAKAPGVHPPSRSDAELFISPLPCLVPCQSGSIGNQWWSGIETNAVFTDGSQRRAGMRQKSKGVMTDRRAWAKENH